VLCSYMCTLIVPVVCRCSFVTSCTCTSLVYRILMNVCLLSLRPTSLRECIVKCDCECCFYVVHVFISVTCTIV